jgi:ABC-type antimicrobial peptide transport system permease subunit
VLRQGITMAALGAGIGLAAAIPLTRFMGSLLFAISAADPWTYSCVIALLLGVSIAGSRMRAYRAARMNPVDALRYESRHSN